MTLCYYRGPCSVSHITVYRGRTDDRSNLIDKFCNSNVQNKLLTLYSNFAYVKFQTGPSANTRGHNGFSEIVFKARGTNIHNV